MSTLTLYSKIEALPEHLKKQVAEFIDMLLVKKNADEQSKAPLKFKPGFGGAKGMFIMASDFDEPLEDFKEYM